jgi:hypothetical protein
MRMEKFKTDMAKSLKKARLYIKYKFLCALGQVPDVKEGEYPHLL